MIRKLVLGGLFALGLLALSAETASAQYVVRGGGGHYHGGGGYYGGPVVVAPRPIVVAPSIGYGSPYLGGGFGSPYLGGGFGSPSFYRPVYGGGFGGYPSYGYGGGYGGGFGRPSVGVGFNFIFR